MVLGKDHVDNDSLSLGLWTAESLENQKALKVLLGMEGIPIQVEDRRWNCVKGMQKKEIDLALDIALLWLHIFHARITNDVAAYFWENQAFDSVVGQLSKPPGTSRREAVGRPHTIDNWRDEFTIPLWNL